MATSSNSKAKNQSRLPSLFGKRISKPAFFAVIFALVGVSTLLLSYAAEPPQGPISNLSSKECLENFFNRHINTNFISTYPCNDNNQGQKWVLVIGNTTSNKTIRTQSNQNYCLQVEENRKARGSRVYLWQCNGSPGQQWRVRDNKTIRNPNSGLCLEATREDSYLGGPNILMQPCNANNKRQQWNVPKEIMPSPLPEPEPENPPGPGEPPTTPPSAWKPLQIGTAWQWQLTGAVNETVLDGVNNSKKMYDVDMFNASPELISRLKAKGIYVVCYVESGDWASGRPDVGDYAPAILGRNISGFPDEKFVNVTALDGPAGPTGKTLRQIMRTRLELAKQKGCDGIEPDLDDLHTYNTGFSVSESQMVAYNKVIVDMGHTLGMSVGLKNGASGGSFEKKMLDAGADWALNEECNQFDECGGYKVFIDAGKPVFQVEYLDNQRKPYSGANGTCAKNNAANFDGIVKDSSSKLSALPRIACR